MNVRYLATWPELDTTRRTIARRPTSGMGQSRHFGGALTTSGLPLSTDILRVRQHVSKVPGTETRQGGSRPLKCPQWLLGERTSAKGGGGLGPNRAFSTRGRRVRIWSPGNENIGGTLQHRFTPLIAQEVSVTNDSPIGFGFRLTHLQNRHFEIELITRAYRVRQS